MLGGEEQAREDAWTISVTLDCLKTKVSFFC